MLSCVDITKKRFSLVRAFFLLIATSLFAGIQVERSVFSVPMLESRLVEVENSSNSNNVVKSRFFWDETSKSFVVLGSTYETMSANEFLDSAITQDVLESMILFEQTTLPSGEYRSLIPCSNCDKQIVPEGRAMSLLAKSEEGVISVICVIHDESKTSTVKYILSKVDIQITN